jgi:hypothetical protein
MTLEHAEEGTTLAEKNRRLQALVGELLTKNEGLRQRLALLEEPANPARPESQSS